MANEQDPIADLLLSMDAKLDDIGANVQAAIDSGTDTEETDENDNGDMGAEGTKQSESSDEEGIGARAQGDLSGPQTHSRETAASGGASVESGGIEPEFTASADGEHTPDHSPESGHWYYRKRFGV